MHICCYLMWKGDCYIKWHACYTEQQIFKFVWLNARNQLLLSLVSWSRERQWPSCILYNTMLRNLLNLWFSNDGFWLDGRGVGVRVPVGAKFSLLHAVQTGSGVHLISYPMGTGGPFPGGWSGTGLKLTTHPQLVQRSRIRGSIHPLPHTSSLPSP
jgi:hypothetical protein